MENVAGYFNNGQSISISLVIIVVSFYCSGLFVTMDEWELNMTVLADTLPVY